MIDTFVLPFGNRRGETSGFDGDGRYLFFVDTPVAKTTAGKCACGIFPHCFHQRITGGAMGDGSNLYDLVSQSPGYVVVKINQIPLGMIMDYEKRVGKPGNIIHKVGSFRLVAGRFSRIMFLFIFIRSHKV